MKNLPVKNGTGAMFHVVKINWFVDGKIGIDTKIHHALGSDIIVFCGEESEIILYCDDLTETWGQGSVGHHVLNYDNKKIETTSNMEARYWAFDNVDNFGLVDYEILASYSLKDFEEKNIGDELVYDATENKKFYSL